MHLPIPDLDDRNFDDLMEEAKSLIPRYNREWTNYNPSDPGITLLELFAWLSEMIIYRVNQVPEKNYWNFLKLILGEKEISKFKEKEDGLELGISRALEFISHRHRAVTTDDYEFLAMEAMEGIIKGLAGRVICLNNRDLDYSKPGIEKLGHISVIIIPTSKEDSEYCKNGKPTEKLGGIVKNYLNERRLITTRVHVSPFKNIALKLYKKITLETWIVLEENAEENTVKNEMANELQKYLDPLKGGANASGWPVGRNLYQVELYRILESIPGVDYVSKLLMKEIKIDKKAEKGYVESEKENYIKLEEYQLVELYAVPNINVIED